MPPRPPPRPNLVVVRFGPLHHRCVLKTTLVGAHGISMGARGPAGVHHGDLQQLGKADSDAQERKRFHVYPHVKGERWRVFGLQGTRESTRRSAFVPRCTPAVRAEYWLVLSHHGYMG